MFPLSSHLIGNHSDHVYKFHCYSLTKDMNGREDIFRAAAVRALCAITDSSTLQGIERYMKQAIVDKVINYFNILFL